MLNFIVFLIYAVVFGAAAGVYYLAANTNCRVADGLRNLLGVETEEATKTNSYNVLLARYRGQTKATVSDVHTALESAAAAQIAAKDSAADEKTAAAKLTAALATEGAQAKLVVQEILQMEATDSTVRSELDRALTYVERIVDRQINKVRGLLTFGGILILAIRLATPQTALTLQTFIQTLITAFSMACAWTVVVFCLELLFVRWVKSTDLAKYSAEITNTIELARKRTILIQIAVALTIASVIALGFAAVVRVSV